MRSLSARHRPTPGAFTLIELLIVVAIIAILAAIAIPNFIEAQVRAKVSRCLNDMRSIGVALEAYRLDWNDYPIYYWWEVSEARRAELGDMLGTPEQNYGELAVLTTPVPYLSAIPVDPFQLDRGFRPYDYTNAVEGFRRLGRTTRTLWSLRAFGPDRDRDAMDYYDPTNGTVSNGDLSLTNLGFYQPFGPVPIM